MSNFTLLRNQAALLIVDMQGKVFAAVDHGNDILQTILRVLKGFQALVIPVFVSEQCPDKLGESMLPVRIALGNDYKPYKKTTFSCVADPEFLAFVKNSGLTQWVLVGIEAHVCVLQTAKDLLNLGMEVVVLNDAISSRSIYDFSTGIAEMRDAGVRISCAETVLFELLRDSRSPEFKEISQLVKSRCCCE
jgi:nicotinamidase-related amidase